MLPCVCRQISVPVQFFNSARVCLLATLLPCIGGITLDIKQKTQLGANQNLTLDGTRDLVFIHIPYNFGHTVEMIAAFGGGTEGSNKMVYSEELTGSVLEGLNSSAVDLQAYETSLPTLLQDNAEVWGTLRPSLIGTSSTGCPLGLTPPKHMPPAIARDYFGNKTRFGILRDPYERLVAFFHGSVGGQTGEDYGGNMTKWAADCDVNGAINHMMQEYLHVREENPFVHGCAYLPQSEYFDGEFGIEIAVDNRMFPMSANTLFAEHGYEFHIETADCRHVSGCNEIWAGSLAPDTRALVRQVYEKDFELLCARFGYCDPDENTCLQYVPQMCPRNMTLTGPNYDGTW